MIDLYNLITLPINKQIHSLGYLEQGRISMSRTFKGILEHDKWRRGLIYLHYSPLIPTLTLAQQAKDGNLGDEVLLAKLNAYGTNLDAFQLTSSYASKRHLRVNVNNTFSD